MEYDTIEIVDDVAPVDPVGQLTEEALASTVPEKPAPKKRGRKPKVVVEPPATPVYVVPPAPPKPDPKDFTRMANAVTEMREAKNRKEKESTEFKEKYSDLRKVNLIQTRWPNAPREPHVTISSPAINIKERLKNQRSWLNTRNSIGFETGLPFLMGFIEKGFQVYNPVGWNLDGIGAATAQNMDKFADVCAELDIIYGDYFASGPERRLITLIAEMCYRVHCRNSNPTAEVRDPVPENVAEKFKDI